MNSGSYIETRPSAPRTALVVDADPQIESLLSSILRPGLWTIVHAPDNKAALAEAEGKGFDVILTSEKTPGRDDVELLRKLRRTRPHTRLIILADESTPSDVIDSMRERAFSYFTKPYSLNALGDMLRMAADGPCWDDGIEILSATPEWIAVNVRCDVNTADRLVQFLNEVDDLPDNEKHAVATAFREILLNAIEYGGQFDPSKSVEISYVRARHMVACRVTDPGEGFTLDEIPHAAIANPADDPIRHVAHRAEQGMRPGGFGVMMAKHLVDELVYNQKGNEALLVKYLDLNWDRPD